MSKRINNTNCHCLKMRRSAENVVRFYDNILEESGVTVRQYSLLYQISNHEGCSVRELSELTELDRSTLARSLKPLMQRELIHDTKASGARDSRLVLTDEGRRICDEAGNLWSYAQEQYETKIGTEYVKVLEEMLEKLQSL